ncbi:MAG: hypothetical protein J1E40_08125 [Oscillospiraceae bacterium]|nr:hypothetical protein [Oscillospiraceae bacterium]
MADKSRERNYVGVFSDYGLDERQIAIQNKIMKKSFKLLYYLTVFLTVLWLMLGVAFQMEIPCGIAALSYLTAAMVSYSVYVISASKNGVINSMTATTNSRGFVSLIIRSLYTTALIIHLLSKTDFALLNKIIIVILWGIVFIASTLEGICMKRNLKTLDEQGREDSEEDQP